MRPTRRARATSGDRRTRPCARVRPAGGGAGSRAIEMRFHRLSMRARPAARPGFAVPVRRNASAVRRLTLQRDEPRPLRRRPPGAYWHLGSPSFVAGEFDVVPMKIAQVLVVLALVMFDFHPSLVVAKPDNVFPVVEQYVAEPAVDVQAVVPAYLIESAK